MSLFFVRFANSLFKWRPIISIALIEISLISHAPCNQTLIACVRRPYLLRQSTSEVGIHQLCINNRHDWYIVGVDTYHLLLVNLVGDNIADCHPCSCSCCGRQRDDRYRTSLLAPHPPTIQHRYTLIVRITPTALAVSIDEPPPMAMMKSAPDSLKADTPLFTFSTVGLGLISLKSRNRFLRYQCAQHLLGHAKLDERLVTCHKCLLKASALNLLGQHAA